MATLTVWKFDSPSGAQQAEEALVALQKQELAQVLDAAVVSWEPGAKKPKTRQLHNTTAFGALGGSFWGLLFGLIFFVPLLGVVVGAAAGAFAGSLTDVGIDDDFIDTVRGEVTEGTSALFVMTQDVVIDRVKESLESQGIRGRLIETNLSTEEEAKLREVFTEA